MLLTLNQHYQCLADVINSLHYIDSGFEYILL